MDAASAELRPPGTLGPLAAICLVNLFFSGKIESAVPSLACSGKPEQHTERHGVIYSPSWPLNYPLDVNCSWYIQGDRGDVITISFKNFDLEDSPKCSVDWLMIGPSSKREEYRVCGSFIPPSFISARDHVWIVFHADPSSSGQAQGFHLSYIRGKTGQANCQSDEFRCLNGKCIPSSWKCNSMDECGDNSDEKNCTIPPTEPQSSICPLGTFQCSIAHSTKCLLNELKCNTVKDCSDGSDEENCPDLSCGKRLSNFYGSFASPDLFRSDHSRSDLRCTWYVDTQDNRHVLLQLDLQLGYNDYVKVYDGLGERGDKLMQTHEAALARPHSALLQPLPRRAEAPGPASRPQRAPRRRLLLLFLRCAGQARQLAGPHRALRPAGRQAGRQGRARRARRSPAGGRRRSGWRKRRLRAQPSDAAQQDPRRTGPGLDGGRPGRGAAAAGGRRWQPHRGGQGARGPSPPGLPGGGEAPPAIPRLGGGLGGRERAGHPQPGGGGGGAQVPGVRGELRPAAGPPAAPEAAARGGAGLPVPGVRPGLQPEAQPDHPPADPHGGEALRLRRLREALQPQAEPAHPPAGARRREALSLRGLREELPGAAASPGPPEGGGLWGGHRGEAGGPRPPADPGQGEAPLGERLWGGPGAEAPPGQAPGETPPERSCLCVPGGRGKLPRQERPARPPENPPPGRAAAAARGEQEALRPEGGGGRPFPVPDVWEVLCPEGPPGRTPEEPPGRGDAQLR